MFKPGIIGYGEWVDKLKAAEKERTAWDDFLESPECLNLWDSFNAKRKAEKSTEEKTPGDVFEELAESPFWRGPPSRSEAKEWIAKLQNYGVHTIEHSLAHRPPIVLKDYLANIDIRCERELSLFIQAAECHWRTLAKLETVLREKGMTSADLSPEFVRDARKDYKSLPASVMKGIIQAIIKKAWNRFFEAMVEQQRQDKEAALAEASAEKLSTTSAKDDSDKLRMDLVPAEWVEKLAEVLTYGAEKYAPESWRKVDPVRYEAALLRHVYEYKRNRDKGRVMDVTDDGLHPLIQAAVNCLFIYTLRKEQDACPVPPTS